MNHADYVNHADSEHLNNNAVHDKKRTVYDKNGTLLYWVLFFFCKHGRMLFCGQKKRIIFLTS